ncbi:MAG: sigma-70 family RNA polymerase sigma factor [Alphaproteobacteria bacterium]|nr:sigma-70 family RNA polymerase sigma factor [Alphaproteobacteria bacterium]
MGTMVQRSKPNRGNPLEAAYLTHYAALVDSVAPVLGCRFRAQDVVQDAWIRLAELPPGNEIRQPASYLFRLVRNLAIDRARRLALEIRYGAREDVPLAVPSAAPTPEQDAITQDMLRELAEALAGLPDRTRLVFEMNRIGGHSVDEIAAALDISAGFAYRLLRQATVHCSKRLHRSWTPR